MKYIGIEKRVEIDKTKLRKIEKKIYDYLDYTWEMKAVIIRGNIMEVIPNFNSIKEVNYTDIMPWVCREITNFPELLKDLKEIRLLNNTRKQGWVLIEPNNCNQIIHAPLNKVDKMILDISRKY